MSPTFFLVGGIIFAAYMYFTIWNIFYSSRKSREENYPALDKMREADAMDMDGMGNFSRFPVDKMPNKIYFKTKNSKIKKEKVK
jgi:hypothetical protein